MRGNGNLSAAARAVMVAGAIAVPAVREATGESGGLPMLRVGHVGHDHQLALCVTILESEGRQAEWSRCLKESKPREGTNWSRAESRSPAAGWCRRKAAPACRRR